MLSPTITTSACLWTLLVYTSCLGSAQDCTVSNFAVQPNFDINRFMGRWYEKKWIPQGWFPVSDHWKDFQHIYTKLNDTYVELQYYGREAGTDKCVEGKLSLTTTAENGKFILERNFNTTTKLYTPYWVMLTDYDNYAMVYGCREAFTNGTCSAKDSWMWSRAQTISNAHVKLMENKATSLCLTMAEFHDTPQEGICPASSAARGVRVESQLLFGLLVLLTAALSG